MVVLSVLKEIKLYVEEMVALARHRVGELNMKGRDRVIENIL